MSCFVFFFVSFQSFVNFFFSHSFFVDLNSLIPKKHTLVVISAFMDWPFFIWNVRFKYSPAFELRPCKGWITKDFALKKGSVWCWFTVQSDTAWLRPEMLSLQRVCVCVFTVLRYKSLEEWHSESWSICIVCDSVSFMFWGQLCVCVCTCFWRVLLCYLSCSSVQFLLTQQWLLMLFSRVRLFIKTHKIIVCPSIKNTLATRF